MLLQAGAEVDAVSTAHRDAGTPLHLAARHLGNPEVVETLIEAGADMERRDGEGMTALHHAIAANPNEDVAAKLIELGASIKARDRRERTPLHHIGYAASEHGGVGIAFLLLRSGADVQARDIHGQTPLHVAANENENVGVVSLLLQAGADVRARDESGRHPVWEAATNPNPEVLAALIRVGGDLHATGGSKGYSPPDGCFPVELESGRRGSPAGCGGSCAEESLPARRDSRGSDAATDRTSTAPPAGLRASE